MKTKSIVLKHKTLMKCKALLPMLYKVSELSKEIAVHDRTLRDWLTKGAPQLRDNSNHIWIHGTYFKNWILSQCVGKSYWKDFCLNFACKYCGRKQAAEEFRIIWRGSASIVLTASCQHCYKNYYLSEEVLNRNSWKLTEKYLEYLGSVKQLDDKSILTYRSYLRHLLKWAGAESLFSPQSVLHSFVDFLANPPLVGKSRNLSRSTFSRILGVVNRFYKWLAVFHPSESKRVDLVWLESLVVPKNLHEIVDREKVIYEDVVQISKHYFVSNDIATKRDCAMAVFLFLSGMRATAAVTLPLRAITSILPKQPNMMSINQDVMLGVKTKNRKSILSHTLPIPQLYEVVLDWFKLANAKTNGQGYFYSILENRGGNIIFSLAIAGNHRNHKLNKRLRLLARQLGHAYMSAHKYRRGHTVWGIEQSKDMKQYKAISLNLGHQDIRITDQYYSVFSNNDTAEILASLAA